MSIQLSTTARNGMASSISTTIGSSALLRIYELAAGAPANCAAAMGGSDVLLAELTCSATFGSGGSGKLTANAITQDVTPNAAGTAEFFRVYASDGTTCHIQGTVGTSGTDMIVNTTTIETSKPFQCPTFELTMPGA